MSDDELLAQWMDEGHWDSEGTFTIDPAKAMEKLRSFALEEPRRYILNLISWAVAAQASNITISAKAGQLEASVAGVSLTSEDLIGLFAESALDNSLARRELAIATISATSFPSARVSVYGDGVCLRVDKKGFKIEQHEAGETRWTLDEPKSLLGWMGRVLGDERLEIPLLKELCAHAEIPILLNGSPLFSPIELPRVRKAIQLVGPALPVTPEQIASSDVEMRPSVGDFSALVVASTTPILPTRALYIVRGVSFEMPPVEVYGENFAVVVNAPGLSKDLSGRGLVENEERRRIQAEIAKLAQELWQSP